MCVREILVPEGSRIWTWLYVALCTSRICAVLFFFLIYLFIFWLHWVFVATHRLSLVAASGGHSLLQCAWASHCSGFSCCGAWALRVWASVVVACGLSSCGSQALECRLSSCGTQAQLLRGMWDLPRPGLEPVSPALAGGFSTTVPPGKPCAVLESYYSEEYVSP